MSVIHKSTGPTPSTRIRRYPKERVAHQFTQEHLAGIRARWPVELVGNAAHDVLTLSPTPKKLAVPLSGCVAVPAQQGMSAKARTSTQHPPQSPGTRPQGQPPPAPPQSVIHKSPGPTPSTRIRRYPKGEGRPPVHARASCANWRVMAG